MRFVDFVRKQGASRFWGTTRCTDDCVLMRVLNESISMGAAYLKNRKLAKR